KHHVTLEIIRPFSKAGPKKAAKNCGRKLGCCRILTNAPEKHETEELAASKNRKDDHDYQIELNESSQSEEASKAEILDDLKENDFVLVNLATKKMSKFYVAKVMDISDNTVEVKYLKKIAANKFAHDYETVYDVDKMTEIVFKLPPPHDTGGTKRKNREMTFYIDFSLHNMGYLLVIIMSQGAR
ncbi:hypothetical protein ILUMI_16790, partial [Ignelater luminosus]